jgi:hypothetical protein
MRKSRFTEAQIIGMIKEQEAGMPTAEVCRKHGVSQSTFYKYKSKYGGMEVSVVAKRRRFGYRRIGVMLVRKGMIMNHKKLYRLYTEEKLGVRRRRGLKRARDALKRCRRR